MKQKAVSWSLLVTIASMWWGSVLSGGVEKATPVTWKDLADVSFRERFNLKKKDFDKIPAFGSVVKQLEGRRIQIKGYMIPLSIPDDLYVISEKPMTSCFFCGGAGQETLIELSFVKPRRFKTDEIRTVSGILELNGTDTDRLCYRMVSVEVVE